MQPRLNVENALADGKLIPIGDVMDRIETAAMVFRNGSEGMVRNVEAVCCDQCKPVIGEACTGRLQGFVQAIRESIEG